MRRLAFIVLALHWVACGRTTPVHYPYIPDQVDAGRELIPCVTGVIIPEPGVPAVMLVVDRSGSMNFDFAGNSGPPFGNTLTGPRRWTVLRASLENTLTQFDDRVAFGMVMFPGDDLCGVSASIELMPKAGNATEVMARLNRVPQGGTPTFEALNSAGRQLASVRGQALVLITDGDPNCNENLNPDTCDCTAPLVGMPPACNEATACRDGERAIDGLRRLRMESAILTYVVGVGASSTPVLETLDNMAIAGGAPRVGGTHSFYSGATEAELAEALQTISARLTRCTWSTGTRLGPNDRVEVTVGGVVVPAQAVNGWDWVDATSGDLLLRGSWCERAAAGQPVRVRLDCR